MDSILQPPVTCNNDFKPIPLQNTFVHTLEIILDILLNASSFS